MKNRFLLICLLVQSCVAIDNDLPNVNQTGKWTLYDTQSGLPSNTFCAIATDKQGVLWVAFTDAGVASYENEQWTVYNTSNSGLLSNRVTCLLAGSLGGMYIGTEVGLSIRYTDGSWDTYTGVNPHIETMHLHSMKFISDNEIWLGTNNGYYVFYDNGDIWRKSIVNAAIVSAIEKDARGNIWAGTYKGLFRFIANNQFSREIDAINVKSLFCDSKNRLWIGTQGDMPLGWLDASLRFRTIPYMADPRQMSVNQIFEDRANHIWFATSGNGLIMYDNVLSHFYAEYTGFYENDVNAIGQDKDGNLWFGLNTKGLLKYELPVQ